MDTDVANIYPISCNGGKQTAIRLNIGKALKSALLEAQRSGAPLRLKVEPGLQTNSVKATIRAGSQTHTLVGRTIAGNVDALKVSDEAGAGDTVAKIVTNTLKAQQKDIATARARLQAAAQQTTVQRHHNKTVLLDAPIHLQASQKQVPAPTMKPSRTEHNSRVRNTGYQRSSAKQLGPSSKGAASSDARFHPSTPPVHQVAGPRQGTQQSCLPPRGPQHHPKSRPPTVQASGKDCKAALPAAVVPASAVGKRKLSNEQAPQQWMYNKRQCLQGPQVSKPTASVSGQWGEFARSGSGHMQHSGGQQPQGANGGSGISRSVARVPPNSSTQRTLMPAQGNSNVAAGKSRPVVAHASRQQQQQPGMRRSQNEPLGHPSVTMQHTKGRSGGAQSHANNASKTNNYRLQEKSKASAVGNSGKHSAAVAASQLERRAQLRSNLHHQQYYEIEESEVLEGLDAGGEERLHRSAQPDPTPSAAGTASRNGFGGQQKTAVRAGQGQPDQQQSRHSSEANRARESHKRTRQQQDNAASIPFQPASKLARTSQTAQPASSKVVAPKPARAASTNQPQPQQTKQHASAAGAVGASKPAMNAGEPARAVAAKPAANKQPMEQQLPTDSNVSSRFFVSAPGHVLSFSEQTARQRSITPESIFTSGRHSRPIDLGPPGYEAFVHRPARSFQPITSQQQYNMYQQQYETQLAMHDTLQLVIDANVRSVMSARTRHEAAPAGSQEQQHAAIVVEAVRRALKPATENYMRAKNTLLAEVHELLAHINQWSRRDMSGFR